MKNETYYRLNNLIICSTPGNQLCWINFVRNDDECVYHTGHARLIKKKNILVLMPIKNEQIVPFDSFIAFTELFPKLALYKGSKYYCKFCDMEAYKMFYTHSNNLVSKAIAKDLIITIYPDVLLYKKQLLVERIKSNKQ